MKIVWHNKKMFKLIPKDDRFVSKDGQILSFRTGKPKILVNVPDFDGYLKVSRPEVKVHHAVLLAWKAKRKPGTECRHLDGIKTNNHVSNLIWGTQKENGLDKRRHGNSKGVKNPAVKITPELVLKLREEYKSKPLKVLVEENKSLSKFCIWAAVSGYTWSHLPNAQPGRRTCFKGSTKS